MRDLQRQIVMKTRARSTHKSSCSRDDPVNEVERPRVKVISVLHLTEDILRSAIQRGMRILELGCGVGDVSLRIAKLVGAPGLVVGVDESAECIDLAQKRATVAGQCYWTRFVTADLNAFIPREHTIIPHERYDAVVVRRAHPPQRDRATFLRVSAWLRPGGVIMIIPASRPELPTSHF